MPEEPIQRSNQPTGAFVLSLLSGLWMLAAGSMMGGFGWGGMMMGGWFRSSGGAPGSGVWWPWFSASAGIIVLVGAIMLYVRPVQRRTWGAVILIASGLNFLVGMMGLVAGTLGVIGGALALSAKE